MIAISEGAVLMQHTLSASKALLAEIGYMNPSLYIFSTKRGIHIDEALLGTSFSAVAAVTHLDNDTIFKDTQLTKSPVYLTVVTFQFQGQKDADNMQKAMNIIASTQKPDMMGVVISALFRAYFKKEKDNVPKSVLDDPSAVRVLHSFFYTKKDKNAYVQNIPFVNRGTLPEGVTATDVNYDITFMDSGWIAQDKENVPRFSNPYNQEGAIYAA